MNEIRFLSNFHNPRINFKTQCTINIHSAVRCRIRVVRYYSGLATSFIFIGNGLGTIFFNSLAAIYVNTENVSADKQYDEDHPNEK